MQGHIRKRGAGYQVAIYLGTDPVTKKAKYKYQAVQGGKKDAQKVLQELLHQVNTNTFVDPGKLTFGQYLEKWLEEYCKSTLAPLTYRRYEEIVKLHIVPDIGKIQFAKLKPLDLQKHYTKMLKSGRKGLKRKNLRGLSPTTVLFHHRVIHKALEQAVRWQLLGRNVADAVDPPRKAKVEYSLINKEEIKKILEVAKKRCPVAVLPFYLAAVTGMRRGEVLGLRWKDFYPETRTLSINMQVQRIDGELKLCPLKTKKSDRLIELSKEAAEILKRHKVTQEDQKSIAGKGYNNKGLIFCWEDGRPVDPDYVTKRFIKIASGFGLSVRFHDLRHNFATLLLKKNINAKIVSNALGHGTIGITVDTYSHIIPSMQTEVANVVSEELGDILSIDNES